MRRPDPAIRQRRREASALRQEISNALTPQQRLDLLDAKLGPGVGAVRERARLLALIKAAKK